MNLSLDTILYIAQGSIITLKYSIISVFFGIIIAVFLTFCNFSSKILKSFSGFYVSIFRGTPLLIQLSFIYFALPGLLNINISGWSAGVLAFSLNSGAYISETIRAGINSIDRGQFEAAITLGINKRLMFKDIILPQAIKNILPALVNEIVNMLKESAIISMIGEADLMRRAQIVAAEQYTYFTPLLVAATCYYLLVTLFSYAGKRLEAKLK